MKGEGFGPAGAPGAPTANQHYKGDVYLYSQPITTGMAVDAIFDCFGFDM